MVYGIIAALDEEMAPLLANMQVAEKKEVYGTTIYKGVIGRHEAVLCKCGIATINAALCTSVVIREFGADAIINTGIAGALGQGVNVLDVVISASAAYHDRHDEILAKYYPFATCFKADAALIEAAQKAAAQVSLEDKPLTVHTGLVVSGDWFVTSSEVKHDIVKKYNPLCVEMEGAAIANAAFINSCPFVVIRTMSDSADEGASISYDALIGRASVISAAIVLKMLDA